MSNSRSETLEQRVDELEKLVNSLSKQLDFLHKRLRKELADLHRTQRVISYQQRRVGRSG